MQTQKASLALSLSVFAVLTVCGTHAYDAQSGRVAVDMGAFLSQHDVVYRALPTRPYPQAMPVANGRVGAMVWQENGLTMQVHAVDAAPHSSYSQARVRISSEPKVEVEDFEQRLRLYDGDQTVRYNASVSARLFGVPGTELLGVAVRDTRKIARTVTVDVNVWGNGLSFRDSGSLVPEAWKTCTPFVDQQAGCLGITRGISALEPFGYTFAACAEGAPTTLQVVDDNHLRITLALTPETTEYVVWFSTATVQSARDGDSKALAQRELSQAKGNLAQLEAKSKAWWHAFWERSFMCYRDGTPESDYLENLYYVSHYLLAGAGHAKFPIHFISGVYRCDYDRARWIAGYWHFNERALYNGLLASNRLDIFQRYIDFYLRLMPAMQTYTHNVFGFTHGALKTTETVRWDGYPFKDKSATLDRKLTHFFYSPYVDHIFSTGPEVAHNMWRYYQYSKDLTMLERCYPYLEAVAQFIAQWVRYDEQSGLYRLEDSNSLENWWRVPNATPDNAAIRAILPKFIEVYGILGRRHNAALVAKCKDILEKLEPISLVRGENRYAPYNIYAKHVRNMNMQNPELEVIYPHEITGIGYPDYATARNTYAKREFASRINIWTVDGVQAARLGMGDEAERVLKAMTARNQSYACGLSADGNGVLESDGYHILTMNEMFLQSYDGVLRVFPAVPSRKTFSGAFTLLAQGGFLVSAEHREGAVQYVAIKSQHGGAVTLANPWETPSVNVNGTPKKADPQGRIIFETEAGKTYLIENPTSTLQGKPFAPFTGTPNATRKTFRNRSLGL